jgi:hypothetical protein
MRPEKPLDPTEFLRDDSNGQQPSGQQPGETSSETPLPHESDQEPESQHEEGTRRVGRQAHEDLERGLVDTDRRGGADYQKQLEQKTPVEPAGTKPPR